MIIIIRILFMYPSRAGSYTKYNSSKYTENQTITVFTALILHQFIISVSKLSGLKMHNYSLQNAELLFKHASKTEKPVNYISHTTMYIF